MMGNYHVRFGKGFLTNEDNRELRTLGVSRLKSSLGLIFLGAIWLEKSSGVYSPSTFSSNALIVYNKQ